MNWVDLATIAVGIVATVAMLVLALGSGHWIRTGRWFR